MKGHRRSGAAGGARRLAIGSKLRRALARNQRIAAELTRVLDAARRAEGPAGQGRAGEPKGGKPGK